ncbi:hypothetical protein HELRODRAFT_176159 [Helobdella robusta]|uniref:Uncharacterized protein n=1 Tax=Helobdella robusta TaxID=6412 RepID=T1FA82_HELRO|nr:hypothetical protein HELRODRAFT_176159 [Helobdella robusta]ESO00294.1 hypothetical protein HELRODRAFT_176159 [Helobdella robusta]
MGPRGCIALVINPGKGLPDTGSALKVQLLASSLLLMGNSEGAKAGSWRLNQMTWVHSDNKTRVDEIYEAKDTTLGKRSKAKIDSLTYSICDLEHLNAQQIRNDSCGVSLNIALELDRYQNDITALSETRLDWHHWQTCYEGSWAFRKKHQDWFDENRPGILNRLQTKKEALKNKLAIQTLNLTWIELRTKFKVRQEND